MFGSSVAVRRSKATRKPAKLVAWIPDARSVVVTGDFSGWSEVGIPMINVAGDYWEADLLLTPGEYQYRLLVDGQWRDHAEAHVRVPNPFGSQNCVLSVHR